MFDKERLSKLIIQAQGRRSLNEFARKSGVSNAHLSNLINGKKPNPPKVETLRKIAEAAHNEVTYAELLDACGLLTPEIAEKLGYLDTLKGLKTAYQVAEAKEVYFAGKKQEPVKFIRVPHLGHIAAGQPLLATDHIEDWELMPYTGYAEDEVFTLTVRGDSMIGARIFDGDKVLVRIQPEVADGEIAVVNVDGDNATLKRVKRIDGKLLLVAENPLYPPIVTSSEQARICGKVVQVIFDPHAKR